VNDHLSLETDISEPSVTDTGYIFESVVIWDATNANDTVAQATANAMRCQHITY
jgi:hypothetical protein